MLPWAQALALLYTTRMAAWTPSLGLRGLFLAALHHSQNQIKSNGERFHVITWYCFALMGPTLCARLDDPYGSLKFPECPRLASGGHFRPCQTPAPTARRRVRLQCHRCPADLPQRRSRWDAAMGPKLVSLVFKKT